MQDRLAEKDEQGVTDLPNTLALPAVENVLTYERQVAEITSSVQAQLAEVVNAQYLEVNRQVQWFIENVSQNAAEQAVNVAQKAT
jgi:phasin family protein